jgi:hypothetical protein
VAAPGDKAKDARRMGSVVSSSSDEAVEQKSEEHKGEENPMKVRT